MTRTHSRRAVLTLTATLVLCAATSARAQEIKVGIDNFAFTPAELTVKPGATVIFENHDDIPHLVVTVNGKHRSKALDTNDRFSVTFDRPGEYAYFCALHPHMKGKIVVAP